MICLDTNYLILGLILDSRESNDLIRWYQAGHSLVVPMPAWYEFLCGPVTEAQVTTMRAFIEKLLPFGENEAAKAAELFDAVGRRRSLRVDAMIAATAVVAGAKLATNNRADFQKFPGLDLE